MGSYTPAFWKLCINMNNLEFLLTEDLSHLSHLLIPLLWIHAYLFYNLGCNPVILYIFCSTCTWVIFSFSNMFYFGNTCTLEKMYIYSAVWGEVFHKCHLRQVFHWWSINYWERGVESSLISPQCFIRFCIVCIETTLSVA